MKYTKILFVAMFTGLYIIGKSQTNLVPNPSFEEFNACPDTVIAVGTGSNIGATNHWFNVGGFTPDYFNPCGSELQFGSPINYYGHQNAHTGVSYVGFILSWLAGGETREYIGVKLTEPLIANKQYEVSFFISLSDKSKYAIKNGLGVYFSTDSLFSNSIETLPYIPKIEFINLENSSENWIELKGTFTANGNEQYITIGNFRNDDETDTIQTNQGNHNWSYYYIDDVSVKPVNTVGVNEIDALSPIVMFPNPTENNLFYQFQNASFRKSEIQILNMLGKITLSQSVSERQGYINLENIEKGNYIVVVQTENNIIYRRIITKN